MTMESALRLLIYGDDPRARHSVCSLLSALPSASPEEGAALEILGEVDNAEDAIALVRDWAPDAVLMDLRTPGPQAMQALRSMKAERPNLRAVVLTMHATQRTAVLAAGADALLLKGCPTGEILDALAGADRVRQPGVFNARQVSAHAAQSIRAGGAIMYNTIVVPLDGSAHAEAALSLAVRIVRATAARLVLVRAAGVSGSPDRVAAECGAEWNAVMTNVDPMSIGPSGIAAQGAEFYLQKTAAALEEHGIQAETVAVPAEAVSGILKEVKRENAGLVVMATHGRTGIGRWIYGSVAETILSKSPVPVLFIRPDGTQEPSLEARDIRSLLVPVDGSGFGEAALPYAASLARTLHAPLHLFHVVDPRARPYEGIDPSRPQLMDVAGRAAEHQIRLARGYLERLKEQVAGPVAVSTEVAVGSPAGAILEKAGRLDASMILMATHGYTGLQETLLGSVALDVLRRGNQPLLLVRPSEHDMRISAPDIAHLKHPVSISR